MNFDAAFKLLESNNYVVFSDTELGVLFTNEKKREYYCLSFPMG